MYKFQSFCQEEFEDAKGDTLLQPGTLQVMLLLVVDSYCAFSVGEMKLAIRIWSKHDHSFLVMSSDVLVYYLIFK